MAFAHLHVHDTYSLLDGYGTPEAMTKRCAEIGLIALAQTNHGSIAGHIAHQKACKAMNIYPVFGCEFYVAENLEQRGVTEEAEEDIKLKAGNRAEAEQMRKEYAKKAGERAHILVLAQTQEGYANLRSLVSVSYLKGFYKKPRIDYKALFAYRKGLFASSACQFGDIPRLILANKLHEATLLAGRFHEEFSGMFALEIMPLNMPDQRKVNLGIQQICGATGIKAIATNDVHYPKEEDSWAQDVLLAVGTGKPVDEPGRFSFHTTELFLRTEEQMRAGFHSHGLDPKFVEKALENAYEVAFACKANPLESIAALPRFQPIPEPYGDDLDEFLRALCVAGWRRRGLHEWPSEVRQPYTERVRYELGILKEKGFANYFLIVWDAIRWAKENGIAVGPARGSSAGSLVAFLLGITDIDPLRHGLSFERFIAPHRKDWPDIDIDFEDTRRGEVKDYLSQKYGPDCVSNVATYNYLGFRSAFRDAARAFRVPPQEVDSAIGYFASDSESTEDDGGVEIHTQEFAQRHPDVIRAAEALQGQIRAGGTHAAGIVLANRPLTEITAMEVHGESAVVALTKDEAESLGLVKIDLLGLRTMTVLSWTIKRVNERRVAEGLEPITLEGLVNTLDDPIVYQEFAAGNTSAVFQFNKQGGRRLCMDIHASCFNDLSAVNALDRPGPLDSGGTDAYIKRKNLQQDNDPIHPVFDEITRETYGVLLYQEQVMRLCRELAGLDWPDVHAIRKTVAKSQGYEAVEEYWPKFKDGCLAHNCTEQTARTIWELILTFGRYGFNKSHSVAYAAIGYACMWLKLYYPKEYLCAVMQFGTNEREAVLEARRFGIRVVEPDINKSQINHSINGNDIYAGFGSIKGIGPEAASAIVAARGDRPFTNFADFKKRVKTDYSRKIHKGVVRILIEAGAFEAIHPNTQALLRFSERVQGDALNLFSNEDALPPELGEVTQPDEDILIKRAALLPFVPTNHPALQFKDVIEKLDKIYPERTTILELKESGRRRTRNEIRTISGMVTDANLRTGEFGSFKKMLLITVEDETGEIVIRLDPKNLPWEADRFGTGASRAFIAVVSPISEYRADVREIADLKEFRKGLLNGQNLAPSMRNLIEAPGRAVIQHRNAKDKTLKAGMKVKHPIVVGLAMRVWEGRTRKTGEMMGFVDLADETTQQIVLLWPQSWERYKGTIKEGHIYRAKLSTMKDKTLSCDVSREDFFEDLTPDSDPPPTTEDDVPFPAEDDLPF